MSANTKRLVGAVLGVLLVAAGLVLGVYLIVFAYPEWVNERFEVADDPESDGVAKRLMIGKVTHGKQFPSPTNQKDIGNPALDFSRLATTYYHRSGPVGRAMESFDWFKGPENTFAADARMPASLLGLCATPGTVPLVPLVGVWSEPPFAAVLIKDGCMASYARPYQWADFYERNPALIELSLPAKHGQPGFTFIRDAQDRGARVRVLGGPERARLAERGPRHFYHVLVVETTRGSTGVVAKELMTKEAMALYFETLVDDGVLLVHTSNRNYDLTPVVADVAQSLGLHSIVLSDQGVAKGQGPKGHFTSEWVLVARSQPALGRVRTHINANPGPTEVRMQVLPMQASGNPPWTDASSNWLWRLRR